MRFSLCAALAAIQLICTSASVLSADTADDLSDAYNGGMAAVRRFDTAKAAPCNSPDVITALQSIEKLTHKEQFYLAMSSVYGLGLVRQVMALGIEVKFALADAALKKKCLDVADPLYRMLISYPGQEGAAVRDRARVGIDDVRAARAHK